MRKSYGLGSFRVLEVAFYPLLGKLPEPESLTISSDESEFRGMRGDVRSPRPKTLAITARNSQMLDLSSPAAPFDRAPGMQASSASDRDRSRSRTRRCVTFRRNRVLDLC